MKIGFLRTKLLLLTLIFCSTFGQIETSFAQNNCSELFQSQVTKRGLFSKIDRVLKIRSIDQLINTSQIDRWKNVILEFNNHSNHPTVHAEILPHTNNNIIKITKHEFSYWASSMATLAGGENKQGSPVINFLAFGKYTGFALNFRAIDANTILVANVDSFNRSAKEISRELQRLGYDEIPLHFYIQKSLALEKYYSEYKVSFGLPVADIKDSTHHFIHDSSYHYSVILLPKIYLEALRQKVSLMMELIEFIKSQESNPDLAPIVKDNIKKYQIYTTHLLDYATANTALIIAAKDNARVEWIYNRSREAITNSIFRYGSLKAAPSPNQKSQEQLDHMITNFFKDPEVIRQHPLILDKKLSAPLDDPKALGKAIMERRAQLEEASLNVLLNKTR